MPSSLRRGSSGSDARPGRGNCELLSCASVRGGLRCQCIARGQSAARAQAEQAHAIFTNAILEAVINITDTRCSLL